MYRYVHQVAAKYHRRKLGIALPERCFWNSGSSENQGREPRPAAAHRRYRAQTARRDGNARAQEVVSATAPAQLGKKHGSPHRGYMSDSGTVTGPSTRASSPLDAAFQWTSQSRPGTDVDGPWGQGRHLPEAVLQKLRLCRWAGYLIPAVPRPLCSHL